MSESFKIQQNVKVNQDLINLRADNPEEFKAIAEWVIENAALLVNVQTALNGVPPALAGNVTKTQLVQDNPPQQGSWAAPQGQQPPSFANPASAAPSCRHGERTYRSGTGKNGKEWKAYFCPSSNRQDQCDAQWVK